MNKLTEMNFKDFIKTNWQIINEKKLIDIDTIKSINRGGWYCNFSGKLIKQLDEFNSINKETLEKVKFKYENKNIKKEEEEIEKEELENEKKELEKEKSKKLYEKLLLNSFTVFECGHCFIDYFLFKIIYKNLEYMEKSKIKFSDLFTKCLFSCNKKINRLDMYCVVASSSFVQTTIPVPYKTIDNTIPKNKLKYTIGELGKGDVIDTSGCDGRDLYMFIGNYKFLKVPTVDYYPVWPLKYLKYKGYSYYLCDAPVNEFDELLFENNIKLIKTESDNLFFENCDEKTNTTEPITVDDVDDEEDYRSYAIVESYPNKITIIYGDVQIELKSKINFQSESYYLVEYPFKDANYANMLLFSDLNIISKLSKKEYLIFESSRVYIYDIKKSKKIDILADVLGLL